MNRSEVYFEPKLLQLQRTGKTVLLDPRTFCTKCSKYVNIIELITPIIIITPFFLSYHLNVISVDGVVLIYTSNDYDYER